eukprot:226194_1
MNKIGDQSQTIASNTAEILPDFNTESIGIIDLLGTLNHKQSWKNPMILGLMDIQANPYLAATSGPLEGFISRRSVQCVVGPCLPDVKPTFGASFPSFLIKPHKYSLQNPPSSGTYGFIRNWTLAASVDGTRWITIRKHTNDETLKGATDKYTWNISGSGGQYFNQFRVTRGETVIISGELNNGFLACCGFEIYGHILQQIPKDSFMLLNS